MSEIVLAAIAADIATLTREVETPTGELGYGVDLSCSSDITELADEVDAFSVTGIIQATVRRLTTPRGSLPDDPDYGLDVRGYLNRGTSTTDLLSMAGEIRNEVTKDDRVARASITVASPSLDRLSISVLVTPADPALGPFTLTLAVTSGAVLLEAMAQ